MLEAHVRECDSKESSRRTYVSFRNTLKKQSRTRSCSVPVHDRCRTISTLTGVDQSTHYPRGGECGEAKKKAKETRRDGGWKGGRERGIRSTPRVPEATRVTWGTGRGSSACLLTHLGLERVISESEAQGADAVKAERPEEQREGPVTEYHERWRQWARHKGTVFRTQQETGLEWAFTTSTRK